jgi:TPR repeat protein
MKSIASMYSVGDGVEKNLKKAISWYFKAAGSGDHESQYMIGNAYSTGDGVKKNYEEAAYWYREAANRGNLLALYNLGTIYAKGRGVEKNYILALKWLKLAEIGGLKKAKNNIMAVSKSLNTDQVKEAEIKAAEWLSKFRS